MLDRVRLVTFDLDDTLVDTFGTVRERLARALDEAVRQAVTLPDPRDALVESVALGDPDRRADRLLTALGLRNDGAAGSAVLRAYEGPTVDLVRLCPDAAAVLAALSARCRLAVVTNGTEALQRAKLAKFGLDRFIAAAVTSEAFGARKPDPDIFRAACDATGVPPAAAVHVGDSLVTDIAGAKAAGMRAVLVRSATPERPGPSVEPDARIDKLRDLPGLLAGWW